MNPMVITRLISFLIEAPSTVKVQYSFVRIFHRIALIGRYSAIHRCCEALGIVMIRSPLITLFLFIIQVVGDIFFPQNTHRVYARPWASAPRLPCPRDGTVPPAAIPLKNLRIHVPRALADGTGWCHKAQPANKSMALG